MNETQLNQRYVDFYSNFYGSRETAIGLLVDCYGLSVIQENGEEHSVLVRPRRIVNNIARLMGIADDLYRMRPRSDSLSIHFWVICIEAIYKIANPSTETSKIKIIRDFFSSHVESSHQDYLLASIVRSPADERFVESPTLNMNIIANIFSFIRNDVVHEGKYSDFHFSSDNEPELNILVLKEGKRDLLVERYYEVTARYEAVRSIIINGLLNFLQCEIEKTRAANN